MIPVFNLRFLLLQSDDEDSIASTSKAAADKIKSNNNNYSNSNNSISSKDEGDNDEGEKKKDNKVESSANEANDEDDNNSKNNNVDLSNDDDLPQSEIEVSSLPSPLFDLDDEAKQELADFEIMIQSATPSFHHHHHHPHHRPTVGVQNYAVGGGTNSAFHRQATGFHHHAHHQVRVTQSPIHSIFCIGNTLKRYKLMRWDDTNVKKSKE